MWEEEGDLGWDARGLTLDQTQWSFAPAPTAPGGPDLYVQWPSGTTTPATSFIVRM